MLSTKAEEAGCELIVLNTRREKPSRTCPCSGPFERKSWLRLWVCGSAGPGCGTSDACGRPETNRSGTDLGSCKRA